MFWWVARPASPVSPERPAAHATLASPLSESHSLENADTREAHARPAEAVEKLRQTAAAALREKVPGVQIDFDEITGSPKDITAVGKFLSPPAAGGRIEDAVTQFVETYRDLFGHGSLALESGNSRITRDDTTAHNGMKTVVWQQELDGIPLFQTIFRASLTKNGEIITLGGNYLGDPAAATRMDAKKRAALVANPPVEATRAVVLAATDIDSVVDEKSVAITDGPQGVERKQEFRAPSISDTRAGLAWVPMGADSARLAWDVTLMSIGRGEMFRVLVDAENGGILVRQALTNYISPATYRVYAKGATKQPHDSPTPMSPGHATPLTTQPAEVARELITLNALNTTASPNGWIDDGGTQTLGNNVDAHTDSDATPNSPDLPRPTSATRTFDFPVDFTSAPSAYKDAAVTQLFYLNNWVHDKLYEFGFTESAGNFQTNNFSRGGSGNDAVQADAQDASGTNNANFSTPPDGSPGRMQMYVFTGPTPDIDGDLDAEIVIHEYTHGLSNRLVGGGVGISANQSQGMGEGWSDFYGLALLSEASDDVNGNYAAGGYATRQFSSLTQNYYFGIRRYPYSTNLLKNPLTFKDIDSAQASSHTGVARSSIIGSTANEVHNEGEVWCVTLWDMRANLITKHGFATGNSLALQLVTDGMKLSPANPNFLQARNAIIQADLVNQGGANQNELWNAFARRGMGASATSPSSTTTTGLIEAYDIPDNLSVTPFTTFEAGGQIGGTMVPASRTFTLHNSGAASLNWTATKNQPWLTLSASAGVLAPGADATVTATFNSAASALASGSYTGIVTFTNTGSAATLARNVSLTIEPLYNNIFTETFETGTLGSAWTITGTASHRTAVTSLNTPHAGTYQLTMDSSADDIYSRNEATLALNLAGRQHVVLNFWVKMWDDDSHAPATNPFTNGADFDGIAVSNDGGTVWHEIRDLRTITNAWQKISIDLDAAVAARGLSYTSNFKIRFNHYDNYTIPTDGFAFDDILVAEVLDKSLTLTSADSASEGGAAVTATLSVTPVPTSALTVNLTSSSANATVPASVVVPAGSGSVTFPITPVDDPLLDGSQPVLITATAATYPNALKSFVVHDNEAAVLTIDVPESVIEGSSPPTGLVTVNVPVDSAVAVTLTSDSPSAQLPATVTIPAGATSAQFSINLVNDNQINGNRPATITASVQGWTAGADTMTILDEEISVLTLTLPVLREGDTGKTATAKLSGTLAANLVVTLASSDSSALVVPASVTIPAGQLSTTIPLTIVDDTLPDGSQPVVLTAIAAGFPDATVSGNVEDNDAHHFMIAAIPGPVVRNSPVPVSITALDVNGTTITNFAQTLAFSAADASMAVVPVNPPSAGGFVNGVLTLNLAFSNFATGVVLTAQDGGGHTGTSNAFDVTTGPLDHFAWTTIPSPQAVDAPFQATLRAQDVAGNTVTSFTGSASVTAATPATVEVLSWTAYANPTEYAQTKQAISSYFSNYHETSTTATSAATLATQLVGKNVFLIVEQAGASAATLGALGTSWTAVLNNFVNGGGTVIACSNTTSEHLILANSGLLNAVSVSSPSSASVTKTADTPVNTGVSTPFNGTNLHTFTTANGSVDLQTTTGEAVVISRTAGAGRVVLVGTDFFTLGTGMDRAIANTVALAASLSSSVLPVAPANTGNFTAGEWSGPVRIPFAATWLALRATSGSLTSVSNFFTVNQPQLSFGGIFTEDYESGALNPSFWTTTGTGNFRTQVTTLYSPHGGTKHMTMDSTSSAARNEATLALNLSGATGVVLKFWAAGYGDEPNGPPASPFTGGADFDGVAISADGTTWWEVQSLRSLPSTYAQFTVDLDAAAAAHGISYGPGFKIRFNQYDDNPLTTDGIVIDDIIITASSPASDLAFVLPPQVTEGVGTVNGSITLSAPAPADLVVSVISKSPSKISVPNTIIIPAGQTSAVVPLAIPDDAFVDGTKNVIFTAAAAGHVGIQTSVKVLDNDGGALALAVPATVSESAGTVSCTVTLGKLSLAPLVITLASDLPLAAQVPATVTVPAGASSVSFVMTIPDDTVVDGDQAVHLTATAAGWAPAGANLLVQDNENRNLVLTIPPSFRETDAPKTGTVRLSGTVTVNLVVSLSSSDTSEMTVPATVTIPAGQSSAPFTLTVQDDGLADGTQSFALTASAATFISAQATGIVRDNEAHHFTFEPIGSPQLKNGPVPAIITARDANGAVAKDCTVPIFLSATSDSGPLVVSPDTGGGFVNGIWSGSVQIDAQATHVVLTASDGAGHAGSSNPFDLTDGTIDRFEWTTIPTSQTLDTPFPATVRAVEASGATATGYNGIANLFVLASSPNATIGSGGTTSSDTIGTYSHDSRSSSLYTATELGGGARITALAFNLTTVPSSLTLTNWTIRLKHTALASLSGAYTWDNTGWTTVYRASPVISATGWVTFTFTTPFDYNGTSNLLVDLSMDRTATTSAYTYVQATYSSLPMGSYGTSNSLNGDPLTWTGSTPYLNTSYYRADARFTTTKELPIRPDHSGSFVNGVWTGPISIPVSGNGLNLKAKAGTITGSSNAINVAASSVLPSGGATILAEDFESGSLTPSWWTSSGTGSFRTQVTSSYTPHGGTKHLAMDTTSGAARNEATLTVNLTGRTGVVLKFWAAGYSDEPSGPPTSPFTGSADFDGLAISANGTTWWEVQGLRSLPSSYGQFTVDLDAAIAALGISYNSAFKIRFNQYDDTSLTSDGIVIDDILLTANPLAGFSLTAPTQVTEGDAPAAATITLDAAAGTDTIISLVSSAPAKLAVPASVTVPAGLTSVSFALTPPDDNIADGNRSAVITATIAGSPPRGVLVNVLDNETLPLLLAASNTLAEGMSGQTGTLTLGAAAPMTITVNLASSDTSELTVPASVVFQPGQKIASFPLTVIDDSLIDGTQIATITAVVAGWMEESLTISVTDNETRNLSHSAPYSVSEGASASGSVSISGTLPGDLIITLTSSNPAELTVPASVTIPAGQTSVTYQATAVDDTVTDGTQTVSISAAAATFTTAYSNTSVYDNDIHHFGFSTISSPAQSGLPFSVYAYARDINNNTISSFGGPAVFTAAGDSGPVALVTTGSANFSSGSWSGTVTCVTADSNVRITATGNGTSGTSNAFQVLQSPAISLTPASLSLSVNQGSTATRNLTIRNTGGGTLNWNIGSGNSLTSLADAGESATAVALATALSNLNSNSTVVSGLVPNRYAFTEGVTGTSIGDGGGDMYDSGNILNTNLGAALTYSDNLIISNAFLGAGGKYFTRKFDGLWVFAADVAGLSYFEITGGLGADGLGSTDATVLSVVRNGVTYRGFVKRVYNTSEPSVNHLVIIEDNGSATHEASTNTDSDYHRITGLTGVTRIYEVLYAGSSGAYVDNTATLNIMSAFLDAVSSPAWITSATPSGSIPSGGSQNVTLTISAANLTAGNYSRTFFVGSNDPARPSAGIPVTLTVTNNGNLAITPTATSTASGPRGGTFSPVARSYTLTNTGGLPLDWTASKSATWLDLSAAGGTLAPGGSTTVTATINSAAATLSSGVNNASLAFSNTTFGLGNTSRAIALTVTPAGDMAVTPAEDFMASGPLGSSVSPANKSYLVTNTGDAAISWTASRTGTWLNLSSTSGTLAAGASQTVTATVNTAGINPGSYAGSITFANTTNSRGNTSRTAALTISPPAPTLAAEPPYTPGNSNTILWSAIPSADSYEAQISTDADFTAVTTTAPFTGTSRSFAGLIDGTRYHYRIRAILTLPGGPIPSPWSGAIGSTQDASPPLLIRDTAFTTANAILVPQGRAIDAGAGVAQVTVNGTAIPMATGLGTWAAGAMLLTPGENLITVTASDQVLPPNTLTEVWAVTYTGPATTDADGDNLPDAWESSHGLNPADGGISDPLQGSSGDPDGDAISNLLEFVLGLNPMTRHAGGLPTASLETRPDDGKRYLTFQYRRRIQRAGIHYLVEIADTPASSMWDDGGTNLEEISSSATGDGVTELCTVRIHPATDAVHHKFVRLKIAVD